jgi:RND family efflux transporter MFP subunit
VRAGQTVRVVVEGDAHVYTGQVMRLSPTLNEQNRMLVVEADVQNTGALRPGMFVRATVVTEENSKTLTVPASAIATFAGIEKVFVVYNNQVVEKLVRTGRRSGEWTEVLAGVQLGDAVVTEPGNLQSGQPVTVVEEQKG